MLKTFPLFWRYLLAGLLGLGYVLAIPYLPWFQDLHEAHEAQYTATSALVLLFVFRIRGHEHRYSSAFLVLLGAVVLFSLQALLFH